MDIGLWRSAQIKCPHCKEAITVFPISTPNDTKVVCTFCSHSLLVDLEKAIKITYKYDVTVGQKESDITPSLRILLIEDNIDMQRLLKEEICDNFDNVTITSFLEGIPAIKYFTENVDKIDLLISCMLFPDTDGITILKKCKELYPNKPFIMFTALDAFKDEAQKADAYIMKSSNLTELFDAIKRIFNKQICGAINYERQRR